jgi:hypothetical protein
LFTSGTQPAHGRELHVCENNGQILKLISVILNREFE